MIPTHETRLGPRRDPAMAIRDELADRIESHIAGKAHGRIRDLSVLCTEDLIILRGWARTQHAKQLAQEAVFDVADRAARLANQIVVSCV